MPPAAVFGPGLHLTLPWPFGRVRPVELGVVHSIPLGAAAVITVTAPPPAEAPAPAEADRLWDKPHPAEADWLIAGSGTSGQIFQVMSADIVVLYRVGLADADALHALYNVAEPDLAGAGGRGRAPCRASSRPARWKACWTNGVERISADELQAALAACTCGRTALGLEVVSVTIEAVHPPAGGRRGVSQRCRRPRSSRNTAIATETGRAKGTASLAREQSWDILDKSRAARRRNRGRGATETRISGSPGDQRGPRAPAAAPFCWSAISRTVTADPGACAPLTVHGSTAWRRARPR